MRPEEKTADEADAQLKRRHTAVILDLILLPLDFLLPLRVVLGHEAFASDANETPQGPNLQTAALLLGVDADKEVEREFLLVRGADSLYECRLGVFEDVQDRLHVPADLSAHLVEFRSDDVACQALQEVLSARALLESVDVDPVCECCVTAESNVRTGEVLGGFFEDRVRAVEAATVTLRVRVIASA